MSKYITPAAPGAAPLSGVKDDATRAALRNLSDAHNTRNGHGDNGFVTRGELKGLITGGLVVIPGVSGNGDDAAGKPIYQPAQTYDRNKLKADLAKGVASILAAAGPDYQLWVDSVGAKIEIGHKSLVYNGYSAVADATNTRLPGLAITAGGIAMGYNDVDGNWVDAVAIEAATGTASFSGTINALYGNFAEGITIGSTGKTLGDIASAVGYTKDDLQADLDSGIGDILAGVGGDYRMWVDTVGSQIQIGHKDVVYNGYSAGADADNTRRPGLAITSTGIAMGYNDIDGTWKNSISLNASTGVASFSGTVNALSGNFANGITIGGTSVTLGDIAASGYTTTKLQTDLQTGVGTILAGVGGNYRMWIDAAGAQIQMGHKDLNLGGLGSSYSGTLRSGVAITSAGIAMGYNRYSDGAWVNAVAIGATGDITISGTLSAGSVIHPGVSLISGSTLGTIASQASSAYTATQSLGALATQNAVNLATQVTGQLTTSNITGLGALAVLNSINLGTQTTGQINLSTQVTGLLNGATQVTNLGTLAYANSLAANLIGAGTLAAGVIYSGSIYASQITTGTLTAATVDTSSYIRAYGNYSGGINLLSTTYYPTVFGQNSYGTFGWGVLGYGSSGSGGGGVFGYSAAADGVYGYAASTAGVGVSGKGNGVGVRGESLSASYGGVVAVNGAGGPALTVSGRMTISSNTLVSNLNADLLDGYDSSAFVRIASGRTNNDYIYSIDVNVSAPSNGTTRAGWIKIANNGGGGVWIPYYT